MLFPTNSCRHQRDSQDAWQQFAAFEEEQLTFASGGHFLHTTQVFSPDDQWIAYDTRNDDSQIGRTCCVEMVHTESGEIRRLYSTSGQTIYGPGVGGVTFSPAEARVLFIHGLQNCSKEHPYGFSRRTGVTVRVSQPDQPEFMDARDVTPPFTPGALRGGTHAHTWSGDGQWISFTYNDDVMTKLAKSGYQGIGDLRMVGVMAPFGPVHIAHDNSGENFSGQMFSVVVSRVTEEPVPGSDQIDRAYSDGWVGSHGYRKRDGSWQSRAIAFLGDTRDRNGEVLTEVFIVDIPSNVTTGIAEEPMEGTETERPFPPAGAVQRRLTHTSGRAYPGVQGPRHWLRSAPDGSLIYFLMRDDRGTVQVYGIPPSGGEIVPITRNDFPVETTFSVSPDGEFLAYGSGQRVYITEIATGQTRAVSPDPSKGMSGLKSICWSNDGKMLAYNRTVEEKNSTYIQIFLLR